MGEVLSEERAAYNSLELKTWVGIFQVGIFRQGFFLGVFNGFKFSGRKFPVGNFPRTVGKIHVTMKSFSPPFFSHFSLSLNRKKPGNEGHEKETKHIHASAANLLHIRIGNLD